MRFLSLLIFLLLSGSVLAQQDSVVVAFQEGINAEFKDAATSPLTEKVRKSFKSLDFFPFDPSFRLKAEFLRTPHEVPFAMPTTSEKKKMFVKYGELYFTLKGEEFKLNVYQSLALSKTEEYKDYLFLPFTDPTNGLSTYAGGRYLDLTIPETKVVELDFNKAYNPYCAYSGGYSCPIPPAENHLAVPVTAGVKKYAKH
ncbi:DUF1684 domain-containing protein [Salinimicrobium tongyeongense]|uniref:DUF1684 domain-containing protein n=1 Tax=Salinimicrobium tongyeongense TaxID=2809707 RepID=A0ABY6NP03_9FLAO|nr:DUF1684 domain-containing protein [Salinimicrobium tongyeongense]UZH54612.1 DUF1684 domain-containing protein [Salinimicrobium tongyeongense]